MQALLRADSGYEYHVRHRPDALAVVDEQTELSYAQLDDQVNRLISGLRRAGLGASDRIAVVAKNRAEMVVLLLAALKGGPVCVPINRRVAPAEMLWIIHHAQCVAVFADAECAQALDAGLHEQIPLSQRFVLDEGEAVPAWQAFQPWLQDQNASAISVNGEPNRPYLQIYTSGTSGRPKGVVLTTGNSLAQLTAVLLTMDAELSIGDCMYQALPLFHVGGVFASLWVLNRGVTLLLRQDFIPQVTDDLLASGMLQHATLVPAMIQACLAATEGEASRYSALKTIMYGASPISRPVLSAAVDRYRCDFVQVYGMSETHSVISALTCADHRKIVADPACDLVASAGRAVAGTQLSICDPLGNELPIGVVGEIRVSSQHVMAGYWNSQQATDEAIRDGQLCTGDAGRLDEQGYLFIVDRLKDIIVSGGENISSLEVESALLQHPAITDVAVIGTPSEQWGEAVTALVVSSDPHLSTGDVQEFCKPLLGGFKIPKRVECVEAIPRNAAGKILKNSLRESFWKGEQRHVS